jgi:hypothetical protein
MPSRLQPSVPASFDEIIAACLTKNPDERLASGERLAQMLYPLARRKAAVNAQPPAKPIVPVTLRDRASRLWRSA